MKGGLASFMLDVNTRAAIETMSGAHPLVVFVGAGLSQEAGLPSWPELIDGLLRQAGLRSEPFRILESELRASGTSDGEISAAMQIQAGQYARWITMSHGLLGAAAVVKAWLPFDEYRRSVARCLYSPLLDARLAVEPGPTARELAQLWVRRGPQSLRVVTTNYDLLIERALLEMDVDPGLVVTRAEPSSPTDGLYEIVHLHGVIDESEVDGAVAPSAGPLVLAEDEFFTSIRDAAALERREFCERLLVDTVCLLIGTSFADPNLLSYLYGARTSSSAARGTRFAVVVKQAEQPPQLDATTAVLEAGRLAASERLTRMHVNSLQPEFFCQTSHLLADISRTSDPVPYSDRMQSWASFARSTGVLPGTDEFARRQRRIQPALAAAVARIGAAFDAKPSLRCEREHLALHVWVHDPDGDQLVFGARSDMQFADSSTLERLPIAMPIERLVVESVCSGTCLEASGEDLRSSRWRSMLVVPITTTADARLSDDEPISGLPVGAIVLASDQDDARGLARLKSSPSDRSHLITALASVGRVALTQKVLS